MAQLSGQLAEAEVATHLQNLGYKILARNWKTRACEIDLVAVRGQTVYFIEVKYRQTAVQGSGFDYILPKKQRQMQFAARLWCQLNNWQGDWQLLAAEVQGSAQNNIDLVEIF